jgi:hypothetical protein
MPRVGRQCRIGQVDEDHLTWTDRTVADHLRTIIADDPFYSCATTSTHSPRH